MRFSHSCNADFGAGISASAANIGCRLSGFVYNGTSLPNTIELYDNIDTNFENPIDTITAPTGVLNLKMFSQEPTA